MNHHHLQAVFAVAHASIEGDAVEPACQVGLRNAPADDAFEVNDEVECHVVYVVGINYDDVFAPIVFYGLFHCCKDNKNLRKKGRVGRLFLV